MSSRVVSSRVVSSRAESSESRIFPSSFRSFVRSFARSLVPLHICKSETESVEVRPQTCSELKELEARARAKQDRFAQMVANSALKQQTERTQCTIFSLSAKN